MKETGQENRCNEQGEQSRRRWLTRDEGRSIANQERKRKDQRRWWWRTEDTRDWTRRVERGGGRLERRVWVAALTAHLPTYKHSEMPQTLIPPVNMSVCTSGKHLSHSSTLIQPTVYQQLTIIPLWLRVDQCFSSFWRNNCKCLFSSSSKVMAFYPLDIQSVTFIFRFLATCWPEPKAAHP